MLYTIFILVAAAAAAVFYIRLGISSRGRAVILGAIRVAALIALLLAFFEPALRFRRLATDVPRAVVLLDVSQSMTLFDGRAVAERVVSRLTHPDNAEQQDYRLSLLCFGDSLRPLSRQNPFAFDDRASRFPALFDNDTLRDAQSIIIVSDGNWSNALSPALSFSQTDCYYVRMPIAAHRPFVRLRARPVPPEVPLDSVSRAAVEITGYALSGDPIELTCSVRGKPVSRRSVRPARGFFADTVMMPLRSSPVGTFVYEIRALSTRDSIDASCHIVQQVLQKGIDAAICAKLPSLDKRFLALSLRRSTRWRLVADASRNTNADVVFFTTWDTATRDEFASLSPRATAVFVGCVPCKDAAASRPVSFEATLEPEYLSDSAAILIGDLPPPSAIITCPSPPRVSRKILSASIKGADESRPVPVLYEAIHDRRRVLVLSVKGMWRWQFWPLSLARQSTRASFSDFFLRRVWELTQKNMNRQFYAFVQHTPSYETDSLRFRIVLPARFHDRALDTLRLTLISALSDTILDTVAADVYHGVSAIPLALGPFPAGHYAYTARAVSSAGWAAYSDSLRIHPGNTELQAQSQNTVLLGQFATAIDAGDSADFAAALPSPTIRAATRTQVFRIRQTWYLLGLALALFGFEWMLRKRWRVD